jgi:hypothetical protein
MSEGSEFSLSILTAGAVVSSNCPSFIDQTKAARKINEITKLAIMKMKKLLITLKLRFKIMAAYSFLL